MKGVGEVGLGASRACGAAPQRRGLGKEGVKYRGAGGVKGVEEASLFPISTLPYGNLFDFGEQYNIYGTLFFNI